MTAIAQNRAGELALQIYAEVLDCVRADRLVRNSARLENRRLHIQDLSFDLDGVGRLFVCGSGKASVAMAGALVELLGSDVSGGIVVTKHGHAENIPGLEVIESAHPIPDTTSLAAGERMLAFARSLRPGDLVLYVLSGGTSALLEQPIAGVDFEKIQAINEALLARGADITQINAVRSALSLTKRGKLGEAFAPAEVVVLVLSDVIGNSLATIGSGPFWNDVSEEWIPSRPSQTEVDPFKNTLHRERSPDPGEVVRAFNLEPLIGEDLTRAISDSSKSNPIGPRVKHRFVGSSEDVYRAATAAGMRLGLSLATPSSLGYEDAAVPAHALLTQDARDEAARIVSDFAAFSAPSGSFAVYTGEPTVVLRAPVVPDQAGPKRATPVRSAKGGRCQELATVAATLIAGQPNLVLLAGSTDGTDGPTDAAGALVDGESERRALAQGVSAEAALAISDSYSFVSACGGLIVTGPTQSNLNDLVIVVRA